MGISKERLALQFLRTYSQPFTLKEMKKVMESVGMKATLEDAQAFLESSPNVLELANGNYLTRAAAFTGEIFSIIPTAAEIEQGVLVPGDRCIPFVESERIPSSLNFYLNGRKIPKKIGKFDSDAAIDMFLLFGEEYAPQYIASDPANAELNLVDRDFELPNYVYLTGIDLSYLAEKAGYRKGDRLLCCVSDWDQGKLNLMALHSDPNSFDKGEIGEKRIEWYAQLEKFLLESFDRHGPLGAIEEQLTNAYFENRSRICVPYCGSFSEFISKYSKKVGFEHYGVETRLWHKGQDVPAFGPWNQGMVELKGNLVESVPFDQFALSIIPEFVIDQLIMNCFYLKSSNPEKDILDFISRDDFEFDDVTAAEVILNLKNRSCILEKDYNWFADQTVGPVRKKAIDLYGKVSALVRRLDYLGNAVEKFPSQEIVILAQLNSHILRMLETLAGDPEAEDNAEALLLSLDGMDWNFEDIRGVVESALDSERKNQFKIVR